MTLSGHKDWVSSAAFSPDGTRIVTASYDGSARVWDTKTGALIAELLGHGDRVLGAAFSPDGSRIVTASADRTARVWDAQTGAALTSFSGHTNQVVTASFSPDGSRVVTASVDRTARIWPLDALVLAPAGERQDLICRERLAGAQSFTDSEMQNPMLRGRDDLRHPCDRAGLLSLSYWR